MFMLAREIVIKKLIFLEKDMGFTLNVNNVDNMQTELLYTYNDICIDITCYDRNGEFEFYFSVSKSNEKGGVYYQYDGHRGIKQLRFTVNSIFNLAKEYDENDFKAKVNELWIKGNRFFFKSEKAKEEYFQMNADLIKSAVEKLL